MSAFVFNKVKNMFTSKINNVQNELDEQPSSTSKQKKVQNTKTFKEANLRSICVGRLNIEDAFLFFKDFLGEINDEESEALHKTFINELIDGQVLVDTSKDEKILKEFKELLNLPSEKLENVDRMMDIIKRREADLQDKSNDDSAKITTKKREKCQNEKDDSQSKKVKEHNSKDTAQIIRKKRENEDEDDEESSSDESDTNDDPSEAEDDHSSTKTSEATGGKVTISEDAKANFKAIEVIQDGESPGKMTGVEADIKGKSETVFDTITVTNNVGSKKRRPRTKKH